jgi:hypothetical protein
LYSAEHQKRDMYVGFQAKFFAVLGALAPRLMDKLMEAWMFYSQQSDRPSLPAFNIFEIKRARMPIPQDIIQFS